MRMNRVVFGVSPSPFLLAATIKAHIKQYEDEHLITVVTLGESLMWVILSLASVMWMTPLSHHNIKGNSVSHQHRLVQMGHKLTRTES